MCPNSLGRHINWWSRHKRSTPKVLGQFSVQHVGHCSGHRLELLVGSCNFFESRALAFHSHLHSPKTGVRWRASPTLKSSQVHPTTNRILRSALEVSAPIILPCHAKIASDSSWNAQGVSSSAGTRCCSANSSRLFPRLGIRVTLLMY